MSERRALILAEHSGDVDALRRAATSDDASIRILALGCLARVGSLHPVDIERALGDDDRDVRCRAIELAIPVPSIPLLRLLDDGDDLVVETAAWALGERQEPASEIVTALSTTARSHPVSICREAAVAALGAIGSDEGLDAILSALTDRATVRRRAVLALAPFSGPRVTAALRTALDDRDRQVRQAAEDLL